MPPPRRLSRYDAVNISPGSISGAAILVILGAAAGVAGPERLGRRGRKRGQLLATVPFLQLFRGPERL